MADSPPQVGPKEKRSRNNDNAPPVPRFMESPTKFVQAGPGPAIPTNIPPTEFVPAGPPAPTPTNRIDARFVPAGPPAPTPTTRIDEVGLQRSFGPVGATSVGGLPGMPTNAVTKRIDEVGLQRSFGPVGPRLMRETPNMWETAEAYASLKEWEQKMCEPTSAEVNQFRQENTLNQVMKTMATEWCKGTCHVCPPRDGETWAQWTESSGKSNRARCDARCNMIMNHDSDRCLCVALPVPRTP